MGTLVTLLCATVVIFCFLKLIWILIDALLDALFDTTNITPPQSRNNTVDNGGNNYSYSNKNYVPNNNSSYNYQKTSNHEKNRIMEQLDAEIRSNELAINNKQRDISFNINYINWHSESSNSYERSIINQLNWEIDHLRVEIDTLKRKKNDAHKRFS